MYWCVSDDGVENGPFRRVRISIGLALEWQTGYYRLSDCQLVVLWLNIYCSESLITGPMSPL